MVRTTSKYRIIASFFAILLIVVVSACNEGLTPPIIVKKSIITGSINYLQGKNNWPPKDSLKDLRVIFSINIPDSAHFLTDYATGKVVFTDTTLAFNVDSSQFSFSVPVSPITYQYVAVAQNYGSILQWKVVGLYSDDGITPKTIQINKDGEIKNIKINVDFKNLPPQPF